MTKKVIAIISVLKPIDDTRNFEKIARTIGNTNKYEINIIGFLSKKIPVVSNINFYPIFSFSRLSIQRFLSPLKTYKLLLKLKPELIIVTCADLLVVSILYKILFGAKIVYDVQENYYRNILYSGAYSAIIKYPLASVVRLIEMFSALFVDKFILAEEIYTKQLHFTSSKTIVIENKAIIPDSIYAAKNKNKPGITILYCGTISAHYGVFEAVELIKILSKTVKGISLDILGYAAQTSIRDSLKEVIKNTDFVRIIGMDRLVPHDQILTAMKNANFCVLPYQINKCTDGRIPTKLFECLAMEKPVIINNNVAWNAMIEKNNAGIIYDFAAAKPFPVDKLLSEFYGKDRASDYKWENNVSILTEMIKELID